MLKACYTAPCRWYPGGPIGTIRWYFAKEGAKNFPLPTVFWPHRMDLEYDNAEGVGEIGTESTRRFYNGVNVNNLAGDHYEGTPDDHDGEGIDPHGPY